MTIDQPPAESAAPTIRDTRRHTFALLVLAGIPAGRAYERAGYSQRGARADSAGHKLRHHPEVSAFITQELEKQRESAQFTRTELIAWLGAVVFTPIGKLNESSPLVQEMVTVEIGESVIRTRLKIAGKLEACKQLAALMGWNEPEQITLDATDRLAGLLQKIRER
jgi:hypothetical protein